MSILSPTKATPELDVEKLPKGAQLVLVAGLHSGAGCSYKVAALQQCYPHLTVIDCGTLSLPVRDHLPASFIMPGAKRQPDLIILMVHPGDTASAIKPYVGELSALFARTQPPIWLQQKPAPVIAITPDGIAPDKGPPDGAPLDRDKAMQQMLLRLATDRYGPTDAGVKHLHKLTH